MILKSKKVATSIVGFFTAVQFFTGTGVSVDNTQSVGTNEIRIVMGNQAQAAESDIVTFEDKGLEQAVKDMLKNFYKIDFDITKPLTKGLLGKVHYLCISNDPVRTASLIKDGLYSSGANIESLNDLYKLPNLRFFDMYGNKTVTSFPEKLPYYLNAIRCNSGNLRDMSALYNYNLIMVDLRDNPNLVCNIDQLNKWKHDITVDMLGADSAIIDLNATKGYSDNNYEIVFKNEIDRKLCSLAMGRSPDYKPTHSDLIPYFKLTLNREYFKQLVLTKEQEEECISRFMNDYGFLTPMIDLKSVDTDLETLISKGIVCKDSLNTAIFLPIQAIKLTSVIGEAEKKSIKAKIQGVSPDSMMTGVNEEIIIQNERLIAFDKKVNSIASKNKKLMFAVMVAGMEEEKYKKSLHTWDSWTLPGPTYRAYTQEQQTKAIVELSKYKIANVSNYMNRIGINTNVINENTIGFTFDGKSSTYTSSKTNEYDALNIGGLSGEELKKQFPAPRIELIYFGIGMKSREEMLSVRWSAMNAKESNNMDPGNFTKPTIKEEMNTYLKEVEAIKQIRIQSENLDSQMS